MPTIDQSFANFTTQAFRLEALTKYAIPSETESLESFLRGSKPTAGTDHQDWLDLVRNASTTGRRITRVRIIDEPLSQYESFELDWAYVLNREAGEEIRTVPRQSFFDQIGAAEDFWLFDQTTGYRLAYDDAGRFLTFELIPGHEIASYVDAQRRALAISTEYRPPSATSSR